MPVIETLPELSQFALSRFDQCERLFELGHLARANWPAPDPLDENVEIRRRVGLGELFHRLVHWHARGLDVAPLLEVLDQAEDGQEVRRHWASFMASPYAEVPAVVWSEQTLRVTVGELRLQVRYDRLVRQDDGRWVITDWKTGRKFDAPAAQKSWQTRLYRLALAKGGHAFNGGAAIAPDHISVVYWHVPSAEAHTIPYSASLMAADEAALAGMGERLRSALGVGFAPNAHHCGRCVYQSRCQLSVEWPSSEEAPIVWPTFKFPD